MTIWVLASAGGHARLGLIVGRRHGDATRRNRLKRILREAFRLSRSQLPGGLDIVCTPRPGVGLELQSAMESLVELTRRSMRRRDAPGR